MPFHPVDGRPIFSETLTTVAGSTQTYTPPPGVHLLPDENRGFGANVDSVYNMSLEPRFNDIPHTASTLTIEWFASGAGLPDPEGHL